MQIVSFGTRLVGAIAAILLVAACETTPDRSAGGGGGGAAGGGGGAAAAVTSPGAGQVTPGSQAELEAMTTHRVFFEYDRHNLTAEARLALQSQAAWMTSHPAATITIAGNCDERGTREYNLALGERRANSAKDYLASLGIDPARLSTVSYGKERPIALCSNDSCWSKNRNATTAVN